MEFFVPKVVKSSFNKTFCWNVLERCPFVSLHKIEYILLSKSWNRENSLKYMGFCSQSLDLRGGRPKIGTYWFIEEEYAKIRNSGLKSNKIWSLRRLLMKDRTCALLRQKSFKKTKVEHFVNLPYLLKGSLLGKIRENYI